MTRLFIYWELEKPWQIIYPLLGCLGLLGFSYKMTEIFLNQLNVLSIFYYPLTIVFTLLLATLLIYFSKRILDRIEHRFHVTYKWEILIILFVFSITGSTSVIIGQPFLKMVGITKDSINAFVYYPLFIILSFVFYQAFLVFYGWLFGQFEFFWGMEKKMLGRFGIKI